MAVIDWGIIVIYLGISVSIGLLYSRRAGKSIGDFFISGRQLPWWLAGASLAATVFASDSAMLFSSKVRTQGIAGYWLFWMAALGVNLGVFFFSRLWRRAEVLTDVEFLELRYSGRPAAFLRGLIAFLTGLPIMAMTIGWVTIGMLKVCRIVLDVPPSTHVLGLSMDTDILIVAICMVITMAYSAASGLWGAVWTDFFQYIVAALGALLLAIISVRAVGGLHPLVEKIAANPKLGPSTLHFIPRFGQSGNMGVLMPLSSFILLLTVGWWSSRMVDGGGFSAQRMLAAKDERNAILAAFSGHGSYILITPWLWILVALASFILLPDAKPEEAYPSMIKLLAPAGLKGLIVASFFAAFMSTFTSLLNVSSSYLINDVYKRFIYTDGSVHHYVLASRICTVTVAIIAGYFAMVVQSITWAWEFAIEFTSGMGAVVLLRWFWWRINAWSEISALLTSSVFSVALQFVPGLEGNDHFPHRLLINQVICLCVWIPVTFLTAPVRKDVLAEFYRRVRPGGFWGPVASEVGPVVGRRSVRLGLVHWALGVTFLYLVTFGIGHLCVGTAPLGGVLLALGVAVGVYLVKII